MEHLDIENELSKSLGSIWNLENTMKEKYFGK